MSLVDWVLISIVVMQVPAVLFTWFVLAPISRGHGVFVSVERAARCEVYGGEQACWWHKRLQRKAKS